MPKIATIVGARPQFIKAAVVSRAMAEFNRQHPGTIEEIIIHSGQHYDSNMSDVFFQTMSIPSPHHNLGVRESRHGAMTGKQLQKIESTLIDEAPDMVLVYGDTNTTLAGALAASKLHIPIAHVEAGLRSYNRKMPEEVNRVLTDQLSELLFCPSQDSADKLLREGINPKSIRVCGDIMLDATRYYRKKKQAPAGIDESLRDFYLVTLHRQENTDDRGRLADFVNSMNILAENTTVIFPIHPRTSKCIAEANLALSPAVKAIEPVGYFEMLWLLDRCGLVITDSGGLQKEAYFLERPCAVLRPQTEWVELLELGYCSLSGPSPHALQKTIDSLLRSPPPAEGFPAIYGDGAAAKQIVEALVNHA